MTGVREAHRALARVPGWTNARCTLLGRGSNNVAFLAEAGARRAVLKIAKSARSFPLNARVDEAEAQALAAAGALAPAVLYADDELLLEEYVDGPAWTRAFFGDPARLASLAGALRRLHDLPPTGRPFPLLSAARHYHAMLRPEADRRQAAESLALIESAQPAADARRCHNDLVADNIVCGPRVMLLDWEYAADNDPLFDLAALLEDCRADEAGALALLDAYAGPGSGRDATALADMRRLYSALACLWALSRSVAAR